MPSGPKARVRANIAALQMLHTLQAAARPATLPEQRILAAWSGWGAVPQVFDTRNDDFATERDQLQTLLTKEQYRSAEASILNAHYTDPALSQVIWQALQKAGFSGGRVLEPGCGSGNFIAHAPSDAVMVGVESDPITAGIAALLYPSAQVRHEGFEVTRVPEASFTATVGNVPFGRYALTDPAHNPARLNIHNHFIVKSLALTAPGGYVALLTSRYTLDAANTTARKIIADNADLITAVRLPANAFTRVAGTQVVTDLLVLRRRDPDVPPRTEVPHWVNTVDHELIEDTTGAVETVPLNSFFASHPDHVLGSIELGRGLHGAPSMTVRPTPGVDLVDALAARLQTAIDAAVQHGYGLTATAADLTDVSPEVFDPGLITEANRTHEPDLYTLRYNETDQRIEHWTGHRWEPTKTPKTLVAETRELIGLRDVAASLNAAQRDGRSAADRAVLRGHLNTLYDNYVRRHGPINRFTLVQRTLTQKQHDDRLAKLEKEWREDEGTPGRPYSGTVPEDVAAQWEEQASKPLSPVMRRRHLDGGMRYDPGWGRVASLEIFDEDTGTATKAAIFSTDVLIAPIERTTADTPEEALAMSMDRTQRVDVELIASLLEVDVADARDLLDGLVYPSVHDPDELVPATTALSGNVRTKLTQALAAAETNPVYNGYVRALQAAMPPQRQAEDISVRAGAPWIPAAMVAAFAEKTFGVTDVTAEHIGGRWVVEVPSYKRHGRLMCDEFGLDQKGFDAVSLLEAACNSKSVVVTDDDGVLVPQATFAAQAKMTRINEEFARWLWSDPQRTEHLVAEYNRRFNSLRAPVYDGSHLQFPGMSNRYTPHYYQRNAVARIVSEPSTLISHVVGAGKSGTMFAAAMELRRLGLTRQPWLVVPNSIIEQAGREALQWYPAARVLVGAAATTEDGRRRFIAQTASSEWDLVIIPESAFVKINVSNEMRLDYIETQLDALRTQLDHATSDRSKKRIELAIKNARTRLENLQAAASKDRGMRFEETGCDYLLIDEAHNYKNLARQCNIEELSYAKGSQRSEDLALKLLMLRQRRHDEALAKGIPEHRVVERVASFATGTPIANSLGELWVMQQYLRPDILKDAGVYDLGDWGAAFTTTTTSIEVNTTATRMRPVTRVGKFTNLPELVALSSTFTDVVTRDMVPVQLPPLITGQRQVIKLEPEIEVKDFIADLGYRLENLDPRDPRRDNPLKISTDGRNVSLDPRLAHLPAPKHSRSAAAAELIIDIDRRYADREYTHPETGLPAGKGALQIVFCDRGTPSQKPGQFTIYQSLKDELIARGMPADRIRFVHEARNPQEMKSLFAQCNRGDVSVLVGSTEKMGTGVNIQARAAALYHLDVPHRPCDLEQREGRIRRQGNQNLDGISIFTFVTESTYDTVMWQRIQAKALFIEQMQRNDVTDTEIDDIEDHPGGDIGSAAAETKAIATGDPRYVRQVELDDKVKRLSALQRANDQSARNRDWQVRTLESSIPKTQKAIDDLAPIAAAADKRIEAGGPPRIQIGADTYTERPPAAQALAAACRQAYLAGKDRGASRYEPLGVSINGLELLAARDLVNDQLLIRLAVASRTADIDGPELMATATGLGTDVNGPKQLGLLRRVENLHNGLPEHHLRMQRDLARDQAVLADLLDNPPQPFEHAGELSDAKAELSTLTLELRMAADSPEAKARAAAAQQRMEARGRKPGWSLLLNPTRAVLQESGCPSADILRRRIAARERIALAEHQRGSDNLGHEL